MLNVPILQLPDRLPSDAAIKSWKQNKYSYDPEAWELEYQVRRYLQNMSVDDLQRRHRELLRNMTALASPDRHVIPVNTFLSSWYWYRKEHQTRLEFHLRGLLVPTERPTIPSGLFADGVPRPRHPNAGDPVYKYGKRHHMMDLVNLGQMRIGPAAYYLATDIGAARTDNEIAKSAYLTGGRTMVTTADGRSTPINGDIKRTVSVPNYFLFCVAADWDPALGAEFGVDSCAVIKSEEEFAKRLQKATDAALPGWHFHRNPVQYFDPYEHGPKEHIDGFMSKDFKFAYQRELRYLWVNPAAPEPKGFLNLQLQPLSDIAEVVSC